MWKNVVVENLKCWIQLFFWRLVVLSLFFFVCRGSSYLAEFSEVVCSNTNNEIVRTDFVDSGDQGRVGCDSCRLKNDSTPSTSKHDIHLNQHKTEAGKKRQTYSGPLVPSGMSTTSASERGHSSERLIFNLCLSFLSGTINNPWLSYFFQVIIYLVPYAIDAIPKILLNLVCCC